MHCPRKIEWKIKNLMILIEKTARPGKAGISGRAEDNFEITELRFKLFNNRFGRVHLSNADSMKPDTFFFRASPADSAETLCPAGTVAAMPDGPIYYNWTVSQPGK
jgi:hypothetical protein